MNAGWVSRTGSVNCFGHISIQSRNESLGASSLLWGVLIHCPEAEDSGSIPEKAATFCAGHRGNQRPSTTKSDCQNLRSVNSSLRVKQPAFQRSAGSRTRRRRGAVHALDQFFFPNSISPALATTLRLSPGLNSPSSSLIDNGSSSLSCMARLRGRAPNCGS